MLAATFEATTCLLLQGTQLHRIGDAACAFTDVRLSNSISTTGHVVCGTKVSIKSRWQLVGSVDHSSMPAAVPWKAAKLSKFVAHACSL